MIDEELAAVGEAEETSWWLELALRVALIVALLAGLWWAHLPS